MTDINEDPETPPEDSPDTPVTDETSESPPDTPVGFSFARICQDLGYNPETVKSLTLTETAVYAVSTEYPEPQQLIRKENPDDA